MIIELLTELGFKKYDLALLIFCPAGAIIGSLAQAILATISPDSPPKDPGRSYKAPPHLAAARGSWLILRLTLGAILGLVIALYFVGALQENLTTFAKIIALSILLGYAAPKIWVAQENILIKRVAKLVNQELLAHQIIEPEPPNQSLPNTAVEMDAPQASRPSP